MVAHERQELSQVGLRCPHCLRPLPELGVVRARLLGT